MIPLPKKDLQTAPIKRRLMRRLLILMIILGAGVFLWSKKTPTNQYYTTLPVSFFPCADLPTVTVTIENRSYSLLIDLGSSHSIDLNKKTMDKIQNKKTLAISDYIGIRGKTYPTQGFLLPEVKLSNLTIRQLTGFEENLEFLQDSKVGTPSGLWCKIYDQLESLTIDGRMGWTIFKDGVAYFDFPHSTLIIAKNIDTLSSEAGYSLSDFTKISFAIEKWGVVVFVETDSGTKKFLLDTGATCSVLKDSANTRTKQLVIGYRDLGPWDFRFFEFTPQMECDGILGVDFFKKNTICLDFCNHTSYIK